MGLVGYEDGGLLTNAINENPHCFLLLDEIEKTDRVSLQYISPGAGPWNPEGYEGKQS